ncbi:MAG: hypothetical protein WA240_09245 [Nitrospirota bacterium]
MRKQIGFLFLTIIVLFYSTNSLAWSVKWTHPDISEKAAEYSFLGPSNGDYLKNLGFYKNIKETFTLNSNTKTVQKWIGEGGIEEDAGNIFTAYYYNHFHNPLALSWNQAGLNTIYPFINGKSSLLWAQDASNPWSWQKAREYYHLALTSQINTEREANFAKTFKGVGHIMHLIQDSAQPAHVRNDPHPLDDIGIVPQFENWAKNNRLQVLGLMLNPVFPAVSLNIPSGNYIPITQLWDTDQYNGSNPPSGNAIGISEYTNANFFSEDTIYLGSFPYPDITQTAVTERTAPSGSYPRQYYLKNCCGETNNGQGYLLSAVDYLDYYRQQYPSLASGLPKIPVQDDNVYQDYASLLLPRAVGYSAGLLNYFFRGTLEITAPDTYVYSIIDGSSNPQQFTKIKAKVMNTTPNEQIQAGVLQAVAKYKKRTDYAPDLSTDPPTQTSREPEYSYSVSAQWTLSSTEISSINTAPTEYTFDFTGSPIPAGITDLYLLVIFKGTLGNEADTAIAAGMKDIKEPTHHTFWNLTDRFSLGIYNDTTSTYIYHLYTSDQIKNTPELARLVDLNRNGIFNESGEPYIEPYYIDFKISYMSSLSQEPVGPLAEVQLSPGRYIRLIVLVDSKYNNYVRMAHSDFIDTTGSYYNTTFEGVINQEWENGTWQTPTPIITFRQIRAHFYTGVLRCEPITYDPVTGIRYCPYPEEPAPADTTPQTATINFQ